MKKEKEIFKAVAYVCKEIKNDTVTLDEVKDIFKLTVFEHPQIDITKVYYEKQPRSVFDSKSSMKKLLDDAKNGEFDMIVFSSVKAIICNSATIFQLFREITHQAKPVYIYFEYEKLFVTDDETLKQLEIEITMNTIMQETNRIYLQRHVRRRQALKAELKAVNNDLCHV